MIEFLAIFPALLFLYIILWVQKYYLFSRLGYDVILKNFPAPKALPQKELFSRLSEMHNLLNGWRSPNTLVKVSAVEEGLCFRPDLILEFPRLFQPVMIPWANLRIERSSLDDGMGLDKYYFDIGGEPAFCFLVDRIILLELSTENEHFRRNYVGNEKLSKS
jgi:hypothetical protein